MAIFPISQNYRVSRIILILRLATTVFTSHTLCSGLTGQSRPLRDEVASVLNEIMELGYISIYNGTILYSVKPLYNVLAIATRDDERWSRLIEYLSQYASLHRDFEGEFFLCLYDGWREYSEPVRPEKRQYIPWLSIPIDIRTSFYLGKGHQGEPRFLHNHPTRPDIYPILPLRVMTFNRHYDDLGAVLLPDSFFWKDQHGNLSSVVSDADNKMSWYKRKAVINWHGSLNLYGGYKYCLEGGVGEVLAPYNVTKIHQRILINIVANTEAFLDPDVRSLLDVSFDFSPMSAMLECRYLLDVEGLASSWGGVFWKLLTRESVAIFAPGHWEMWYFNMLKPFVHYLPLRSLHSRDILEVYDWCESDLERCRGVALASAEVMNTLTREYAVKDYVIH